MKISIRLSILSILLVLLLGVSLFIIGVNYYNLNTIFITASKNYLIQASGKASVQITHYLNPLRRSQIASELIDNYNVIPEYSEEFMGFLHDIVDTQGISSVEWGDTYGNYYNIKKIANGNYLSDIITKSDIGSIKLTNTYNSKMELLNSQKGTTEYDPRLRPWFQIARYKKAGTWFIYPILNIDTNTTELGIASAIPIYNKNGILRGVFSLDMPLSTINNYVKTINITKDSTVFVVDDLGNLISAFSGDTHVFDSFKMPKIKDINMPWANEAFNLYIKTKQPSFEFIHDHNKFIAAFAEISATAGEHTWFVGVVTPIQDIIAPLQKSTLISLFVALGGILIGIFLSTIFASSISKPVNTLALDADLICELQLDKLHKVFSHIKEVAQMADAFIKMKNALHSFQRYMPINLVKNLVTTGKVAEVGGELKEITIVFSDVENFTPISEKMLPTDLTRYLSEYFQVATKIIHSNFGTVDKYIGDGVMAFWGAPLDDPQHALHACQTTLQLSKAFKQLNEKWRSENKPIIATRIGINTGTAVVGNVGSDDRLSYTAVGDAVNLASRLENLNKIYGTYSIISDFTYQLVKEHFNCRLLDKVAVKGKTQEVYIYELISEKTTEPDKKLEHFNSIFNTAFSYYEKGDWTTALKLFENLLHEYPEDKLAKLFIERCIAFQQHSPQNWTGVWVVSEK